MHPTVADPLISRWQYESPCTYSLFIVGIQVCTLSEYLQPSRPGVVKLKCTSTTGDVTPTNHHFTLESTYFQEFTIHSILIIRNDPPLKLFFGEFRGALISPEIPTSMRKNHKPRSFQSFKSKFLLEIVGSGEISNR